MAVEMHARQAVNKRSPRNQNGRSLAPIDLPRTGSLAQCVLRRGDELAILLPQPSCFLQIEKPPGRSDFELRAVGEAQARWAIKMAS